jgi:putative oxidoreductase
MSTSFLRLPATGFQRADTRLHEFSLRYSVTLLRIALGFVFILFGTLKFFPGLSPAQAVATMTMHKLTFGLVPANAALLAVAVAEVGVGLCLFANRFMRVALWFLAGEMFAILSPLVLLHGELFAGPHGLPDLLGQYILKDFILLAGVLVLFATQRGAKITASAAQLESAPARGAVRKHRYHAVDDSLAVASTASVR